MKRSGLKRQLEKITYDNKSINKRVMQVKKSFNEVNNIINGGNNKKK